MVRKRPCRVCRKWFVPHRRVGDRQRVCSSVACQLERHRRGCASWHEVNADYDRDRRLRDRVRRDDHEAGDPVDRDPTAKVHWPAVRDAVGLQVSVVVEEMAKVLVAFTRDAVSTQRVERTKEMRGDLGTGSRDAIGAPGRGS